MRVRRAVGAATLALAAIALLTGCTDNPNDKAFGGLGGDMPSAPSMPSMPTPSLTLSPPSGMPSDPGTSSGGSYGGGYGGSSSTPTAMPSYNADALSEVIGENCRYERSAGRISYDVDIQNASTDFAYRYNFTVEFKIGESANSAVASRSIGSRFETVTVTPGGDRSVTVHASHSTNDRLVYSCQVTSATKSPSS
ncbi:hypothetical protein ACH4D5_23140 [Streptomyces sp. NPDC018029]|uniref:hypothetical protein n=1 Tax=Streptomyces sp. NPDC018029 TaxID=3365032 RepID=UPI00378F7416